MFDLLSPQAHEALIRLIDERVAAHVEARQTTEAASASPWLDVSEAADYLRTTPAAIYKRIKRGQLAAHRPEGSRILLRRDDLAGTGPERRGVL